MSAAAAITLPNGFVPRPYQRRYMRHFDRGGKRAIWIVHRRGGKDLTALHQTVKMMHQRVGAYWHVFPFAEQARKAIWEGFTKDSQRIMEQVFPTAIRKSPRKWSSNGEMVVELKCGSIWRLMGSDRMEVVGAGPVGVVFSEFALAKPSTWNLVRPMLQENDGWASFITTPRGNNHAKKLYDVAKRSPQEWFCELRTLFDTRAYDPERTIAAERAEGMPEALIRQEYLCDWTAALVGSVWGDLVEGLEKKGRLDAFEHPTDGLYTSWDLGISDHTSIFAWRPATDGIEVVDHYSSHGQPLSHYFDVVEKWEEEKGYRFLRHWLPHDAKARTLATGSSILEQCLQHWGAGRVDIGPSLSLMDGIQAARWVLQRPGTRIHPRCGDGLEALRAYRYAYDEDKKTFTTKPVHDWASHTADAFRYAAIVLRHTELVTRKPEAKKPPKARDASSFDLDELWSTYRGARSGGRIA